MCEFKNSKLSQGPLSPLFSFFLGPFKGQLFVNFKGGGMGCQVGKQVGGKVLKKDSRSEEHTSELQSLV